MFIYYPQILFLEVYFQIVCSNFHMVVFLLLSFESSKYIMGTSLLLNIWLEDILSSSVHFLFSVSQKAVLILIRSSLSVCCFMCCTSGVVAKNSLPKDSSQIHRDYFTRFSAINFITLGFTFRTVINFQLTYPHAAKLIQSSFFGIWISNYSFTICRKNFSTELSIHLCQISFSYIFIYTYYFPLTYLSTLTSISHCLKYCKFITSLKISESSNFYFQKWFSYSRPFGFP